MGARADQLAHSRLQSPVSLLDPTNQRPGLRIYDGPYNKQRRTKKRASENSIDSLSVNPRTYQTPPG